MIWHIYCVRCGGCGRCTDWCWYDESAPYQPCLLCEPVYIPF